MKQYEPLTTFMGWKARWRKELKVIRFNDGSKMSEDEYFELEKDFYKTRKELDSSGTWSIPKDIKKKLKKGEEIKIWRRK